MRTKGKITSLDIADRAGVSQPTVSRALRGSPTVSEDTRQRILQIARELNYTVDKSASNLRSRQSGALAVLFFEDPAPDDSLINPFFLSMLGSLTRACAVRGYDLLISFQQLSKNWHAEYHDSKRADGLILLGYGDYVQYVDQLHRLVRQGARFVRWGAVLPGEPGLSIGCDNLQGGRDATRHLIARGRRRIAFIGDASVHCPEFLERRRGYVEALQEAGCDAPQELSVAAVSSEVSGYGAVTELLRREERFDALFCASDLIAIGALRALQERGLRVPDDVAVAGFDDIPIARFANPSLTTVQQDTNLAGALLVQALLDLIHGELTHSRTIPATLIVREST